MHVTITDKRDLFSSGPSRRPGNWNSIQTTQDLSTPGKWKSGRLTHHISMHNTQSENIHLFYTTLWFDWLGDSTRTHFHQVGPGNMIYVQQWLYQFWALRLPHCCTIDLIWFGCSGGWDICTLRPMIFAYWLHAPHSTCKWCWKLFHDDQILQVRKNCAWHFSQFGASLSFQVSA